MITTKQNNLIAEFIATSAVNGVSVKAIAASSKHPMIRSSKAMQIRKLVDRLAWGLDELGNSVVLGADGIVRQVLACEMKGFVQEVEVPSRDVITAELAQKFGVTVECARKRYQPMSDLAIKGLYRTAMAR